MALKIWLPLNKDFRNQGLGTDVASVNGTAVISGGSLFYGTTNANGSIYFPTSTFTGYTDISMCFSVKFFSFDADYSCVFGLFNNATNYVDSTKVLCLGKSNNTTGTTAQFSLYSTNLGSPSLKTNTFPINEWQHFAITYSNKKLSLYQNGTLVTAKTYTNAINFTSIKRVAFGQSRNTDNIRHCNCQMADLRVYDHELSAKEVREVSRGLVQHFKLNESYGAVNLLAGKSFSVYNNYGTGMTCVQEALDESYKGQPVRRFTYTMKNDSCVSGFKSSTYSSKGVYAGTCYFGATGTSIPFVYWVYYRPQTSGLTAGGTASNIGGWTATPREYMGEGWWRVGQYRTGNNHASRVNDNVYTSLRWPYAGIDSSCTIDFTVVGYLISGTTEIVDNFVEGNSDVHDCSGFGNDGSIYGKPTLSQDSPRYDASTVFSTNNCINAYRGGMITDEITVSLWGYMDNWANYMRMASCTESGGWNFEAASSKMSVAVHSSGTTLGYIHAYDNVTLANLPSGWHHFAFTYKGGDKLCYYRDGEFISSATTNGGPIHYHASNAIFVGAEAGANATTPAGTYFNGKISDFRIYSKAISADDIAELYHTPASIDNKGNFYCGELKE